MFDNIDWRQVLVAVVIGIWLGSHTSAGQILDTAISTVVGLMSGGRGGY